jgi:histidinol-phosphatase
MQTWPGRKRNRSRRVVCLADFWAVDAPDELLAAAVDITRAASGLAAQRFLEGVPVSTKADDTEITPADVEVEELIRSLIAARFPEDGVSGEELADTPGTTGRRWVIDPIDGTSAFAHRIPMFSVLLAVEDTEGSAAAVRSYPMSQDLMYAGRGLGCWHQVNDGQPQRLSVSGTRQPRGAWAEMVNPATWSEDLLVRLHREVLLLPDVRGTLAVASGRIDALIVAGLPMGYEDVAPLPLLIGEAGGRISDLNGNDVLSGNGTVLASNGHIHDALLDLVRDVRPAGTTNPSSRPAGNPRPRSRITGRRPHRRRQVRSMTCRHSQSNHSSAARYRRLLNVRPSSGSHFPPSANARAAVISDNQPQSLKRLKFLQDGPLAWAISRINRQVYPPSVPVPAPLGDDRQEFDLTIGKRSVTHGASPG